MFNKKGVLILLVIIFSLISTVFAYPASNIPNFGRSCTGDRDCGAINPGSDTERTTYCDPEVRRCTVPCDTNYNCPDGSWCRPVSGSPFCYPVIVTSPTSESVGVGSPVNTCNLISKHWGRERDNISNPLEFADVNDNLQAIPTFGGGNDCSLRDIRIVVNKIENENVIAVTEPLSLGHSPISNKDFVDYVFTSNGDYNFNVYKLVDGVLNIVNVRDRVNDNSHIVIKGDIDSACERNDQCIQGLCVEGVCRQPCVVLEDCVNTCNFCDNGACTPRHDECSREAAGSVDQNPIDESDVVDDQNPPAGNVNPEGLVARSSNFFRGLVSSIVNFVSGVGNLLFPGNNLDAVRLQQDVGGDINGGDDPVDDNADGNINGTPPPAGNVLPPEGFNLDAFDGVPVEDNADGVPQNGDVAPIDGDIDGVPQNGDGNVGGIQQQNSGSSGGRDRGRNNCASAGGIICDQEDHCSGGLRTLGQITVDSGEICCSVGCGSEELDPVSGEIK